MTTTFVAFCDDVLDDLAANVPGLRGALEHRYSPYDPEQFSAEAGERHIAVFPSAENAEEARALVTGPGGDLLVQTYQVAYWEPSGDESTRGIGDSDAAADLLSLAEAVRARFFVSANVVGSVAFGGADFVRYLGTAFPTRAGSVRWFIVGVQVATSISAG